MVKILSGLVAAIVIAVGGFFGFQFYTQHRIASEVETALEQIRAAGGKASHGKVSFDLLSRTVTIADITAQSAAQPPVSIKIGSLTASGVNQPDAARFSAESIEITDVEIGAAMGPQPALNLAYKVPRITVKDYSGPASLQRPPASSSFADIYRSALEQFAGVTAASITAPSLTATINSGAATPGGGEVAYTGLAMQGIKDGKIASTKIDGVDFHGQRPTTAGKPDKLTGNLANIAGYDIDTSAMAAIFDPQKANDDQYYRAYRQITTGPYAITSGQGLNMRIDGMTIDDVGLRPSRMQLPDLLAMIPPPGAAPPTPAQARALIEKVAKVYEGIRIGNAEMRGFAVETPEGPVKLSAMRFNLDNGKVNEFAIEGLDGRTPQGPVKVGRFALKSLDVANLLRMSALYSQPGATAVARPGAGDDPADRGCRAQGPRGALQGHRQAGQHRHLQPRLGPVHRADPEQVAAGAEDVGPARCARSRPEGAGHGRPRQGGHRPRSRRGLDGGVTRIRPRTGDARPRRHRQGVGCGCRSPTCRAGYFRPMRCRRRPWPAQIEAGTIELTLRDTGGIDLAVAQYARLQNVSREAARRAIVDGIRSGSEQAAAANPDAVAAVRSGRPLCREPGPDAQHQADADSARCRRCSSCSC